GGTDDSSLNVAVPAGGDLSAPALVIRNAQGEASVATSISIGVDKQPCPAGTRPACNAAPSFVIPGSQLIPRSQKSCGIIFLYGATLDCRGVGVHLGGAPASPPDAWPGPAPLPLFVPPASAALSGKLISVTPPAGSVTSSDTFRYSDVQPSCPDE